MCLWKFRKHWPKVKHFRVSRKYKLSLSPPSLLLPVHLWSSKNRNFCIDFLTTKFRESIFTIEDVGEDGTLVDAVHLVLVELAQLLQRFGVIRVDEEQVASKQNVDHIGAAALVPYRKDLYTEGEGKGRRCCLGDSIYSIPCHTRY